MKASPALFIGDPWETLDKPKDSSVFLARTAIRDFGIRCYWTTPEQVYWENGSFRCRLSGEINAEGGLKADDGRAVALKTFRSVHLRSDPPVGESLFRFWQLLVPASQELQKQTFFSNRPDGLLLWNEKISTIQFPKAVIPGIFTNTKKEFLRFFESHPQKALILKPVSNAASRGVSLVPKNRSEAERLFDQVRDAHGPWISIQIVDERIQGKGETRAFLLNGKTVAVANKRTSDGVILQHDSANPPKLELSALNAKQRALALAVGKKLRQDGIYFASIDFIADRLLEINVTSTGMVQWLDAALSPKKSFSKQYWKGLIGSNAIRIRK